MHKYHIKITEYAEQDLEDIGNYVAFTLKNPASAICLIHDLKNKMNSLRQMPQKHALDETVFWPRRASENVIIRIIKSIIS